ncbi:MAG: DUF327 family protein [Spirochaetaceae bacterium]|jgi:uncharacterized protein YaaR (DUF327 family)|nr:DUF327 family protein [Spirochaetaceae bacterium]
MANVVFPDGSSPFFNPAAYGEAAAEGRKLKSTGTEKSDKTGRARKKGFAVFFEKAALDVKELPRSEESFHELLDQVHIAGDALSKRPFPPEIKAYKEAVRDFVHYVVENSFDTEEQMSGINIRRRKKFTMVQVIDKKLEEMAVAILQGQADKLGILARIEEINGLLVDLLQ